MTVPYRSAFQLLLFIFLQLNAAAQISLPPLVGDNMVLQRDQPTKIWGWASPDEEIRLTFNGISKSTKAAADSTWHIILPAMPAGGPFTMDLNARNRITIKNILIGDVWLCSGQSNMDYQLYKAADLYDSVIKNSSNNHIREFAVKSENTFSTRKYARGSWKIASPENVISFSAAGYFFARDLNQKYQIPIGIIHSSYPGTPAEAWISEEGLKHFPSYLEISKRYKDTVYTNARLKAQNNLTEEWLDNLKKNDEGLLDLSGLWKNNLIKLGEWKTAIFPGYLEDQTQTSLDGVLWIKKKINVPAKMLQYDNFLELGLIDDVDSTYINGTLVGSRDNKYLVRKYKIPPGVLKAGENWITIRVIDKEGKCGIVKGKNYRLGNSKGSIDLSGGWLYRIGYSTPPAPSADFVSLYKLPQIQYYSKISTLLNYAIKGVTWYQGEGNTGKPAEYTQLLTALIKDWRARWQNDQLPFLIVQLANYMDPPQLPSQSNWALLREAQAKVAATVPNTGLAAAIDLGEQYDIHPSNKEDVGKRLALIAQRIAYADTSLIASGPTFKSMAIRNENVLINFDNVGAGLLAKGKVLKQFQIAGDDKVFYWAEAKITGNAVQVSSKKVKHPLAVRYAWADNPEGSNLYNKNGLPAFPFRTDDW